jgi:2-C-methyl-D-erythritol 4-phosphate cytidylyltransferase
MLIGSLLAARRLKKRGNGVSNQVIAVIPAAGSGTRMGSSRPKQFMDLCGKPMLAVTLERFQNCDLIDGIVLVVSSLDVAYCTSEIIKQYGLAKVTTVVAGGQRRQESVRKGIEAVSNRSARILIHDGVRPLVTSKLIERIINISLTSRAVIPGIPIKDTLKEVDSKNNVVKTVERASLWAIQTAQIFQGQDIKAAHEKALEENWEGITDDAFLIEKMGIPVDVVEGEETNIKITTMKDLELARLLLSTSTYK